MVIIIIMIIIISTIILTIIMMDRSCVRQPRVDRTVWNTSLSIYAPNNMLQVVFKMNTDDLFEKSEHIKIRFFYL